MKRKKRSLKKKIFQFWLIWVLLIVVLVVFYSSMYFGAYGKAYLNDFLTITENHASNLRYDLDMMQEQIENYFTTSVDYRQMVLGEQSEIERIKTLSRIKNSLKTQTGMLQCVGGYFFFDKQEDTMRSACVHYEESIPKLNAALKNVLRAEETQDTCQEIFIYDGETYLLYSLGMQGKRIGYFLNLKEYFETEGDLEILFLIQDRLVEQVGEELLDEEYAVSAARENWSGKLLNETAVTAVSLEEFSGLQIVFARDFAGGIWFWQRREFWGMVVIAPLTALFFSLLFYRILRQTLLSPVLHIVLKIQEMQHSDGSVAAPETEIVEYGEINHQIDEMLVQINCLQEEKMQEKMRANEAQLQYYQLQTDPHFYLNCLNTVSILLQKKEADMANDLILALSAHFRYMFRGNRTLVTVEEEIQEVQGYCDIYNMRSGFPILLSLDVQERVKNKMIPLLCIQTFVENSIKHGGKTNQVLTIRVQVGMMQQENQTQVLHIRVSDNGQGYPQEILEELNRTVTDFRYKSAHVGTDNLKYRLALLYRGEANIYFYNTPHGGAVTELTLPERKQE